RWVRLARGGGDRRAHLRHGGQGHRLRRLGRRLVQVLPRRDAAARHAHQQPGAEVRGGGAAVSSLLETGKVGKIFGSVIALRDVSMRVNAGEVTCVLGDNGAGKSTLIKILSGVHRPDSGEYLVDGEPVAFSGPRDALDRGIATVYQDLAMIPLMSVWRNFFLGSEPVTKFRKFDVAMAKRVAREELRRMGIDIRDVDQPVGTLSGG